MGGSTYICSRGLKRAEVYKIENVESFTDFVGFDFENDFVKTKNINLLYDKDLAFYLTFYANYDDSVCFRKTTFEYFIRNLLTNKLNNDTLRVT